MTGWYYQLVAFMEMIVLVENTRSTVLPWWVVQFNRVEVMNDVDDPNFWLKEWRTRQTVEEGGSTEEIKDGTEKTNEWLRCRGSRTGWRRQEVDLHELIRRKWGTRRTTEEEDATEEMKNGNNKTNEWLRCRGGKKSTCMPPVTGHATLMNYTYTVLSLQHFSRKLHFIPYVIYLDS